MLWISSLVVSALINARLPRVGWRGERQTFSSQSLVLVCWSPGLWAMGDAVRGEEAKEEIGACVSPPLPLGCIWRQVRDHLFGDTELHSKELICNRSRNLTRFAIRQAKS